MARKISEKWVAIVNGVAMVDLVNNEWKLMEFNTKEEAEQEEQRYYEFWKEAE